MTLVRHKVSMTLTIAEWHSLRRHFTLEENKYPQPHVQSFWDCCLILARLWWLRGIVLISLRDYYPLGCVCVWEGELCDFFSWGEELPQFCLFFFLWLVLPLFSLQIIKIYQRKSGPRVGNLHLFIFLFSTALFYLLEVSKAGNCRRSLSHVRSNLSGNPLLFPALLKDSSKSSLCSHLRKHKQHNTVKIPQDWHLSLCIYPKLDENSQRTLLKSLTGVTSPPPERAGQGLCFKA